MTPQTVQLIMMMDNRLDPQNVLHEDDQRYFRVNERFRSLPDDLRPRGRCHCCQVFHGLTATPNE